MSRELPYVLITGFSHSGTSLVCNLVYELGFSPGSQKNMKGFDGKKRPWGYWEHLPLRRETRAFLQDRPHGRPDGKCTAGFLPGRVLKENKGVTAAISKIATRDEVQVYKDLYLPLIWKMFPKYSKYIVISRNPNVLWQHWSFLKKRERFNECWKRYQDLCRQMAERRSTVFVHYEDFASDLCGIVTRVANHVGVETGNLDWDHLSKLYRVDKKTIDV